MNESFWDAHGVEIGACAIFDDFDAVVKNWRGAKKKALGKYWDVATEEYQ